MTASQNILQQEVWNQEWTLTNDQMQIPSLSDSSPPQDIVDFASYVQTHFDNKAAGDLAVLDMGCGGGRNTVYMAQIFGNVIGVDYTKNAIIRSNQAAIHAGAQAQFLVCNVVDMPFKAASFSVVIDSLTSTGIPGQHNRQMFATECERVLKPGGLLLMRCVSTEDTTEIELMKSYPGPEINSSIWPSTNKFQKNFTAREVLDLHSSLGVLQLIKQQKISVKLGMQVPVTNWMAIFKKNYKGAKCE